MQIVKFGNCYLLVLTGTITDYPEVVMQTYDEREAIRIRESYINRRQIGQQQLPIGDHAAHLPGYN